MRGADPDVGRAAASAIAEFGLFTLDNRLRGLLASEDPAVRARAAFALGEIGRDQLVPALSGRLVEERDAEVRTEIALALGAIGSAEAVPVLIELLDDGEAVVRGASHRSLVRIADEDLGDRPGPWQAWWTGGST